MYAGTKVKWHEVLMPASDVAATDESLPLFLCAFSSDKGSEQITSLVYGDFTAMYGTSADFFKYGQPLIQAHKILAAGGRVLGKRIVAEDATLANLIITAEITSVEEQKKNASGEPLYLDGAGLETTDVTATPVMNTYAKIKYGSSTVENARSFDAVKSAVEDLHTATVFPLFIVCDNGRGASIKKMRITPDYDISRNQGYMLYRLSDIENTSVMESARFAVYPEAVNNINGVRKNMTLAKSDMVQFDAEAYAPGLEAFVTKLAEVSGYTVDDLYTLDLLFGKTTKQKDLAAIKVDETGLDITATYGLDLKSGTNGALGDAPFPGTTPKPEWTNAAVAFFNGEFSPEIFDLDQHKIDFCVDANYPDEVKKAISDLADFREDFFYFRDMGLNIHTLIDVQDKVEGPLWTQTPFVGDYMSTYEILDNFTRKQIPVTMTHGLAPLLVNHYATNVSAPIAGEFNNFVISEAIDGTLNIIPRVTPSVDQKEILDDMRVNFVNLTSDGLLAIQSTYTSQDHFGPLSFSSNVIVTQMLIKAIRRYCPKVRFMLMDPGATDFGKYKTLIEDNVISRYAQHFKSVQLIYTRDDAMIVKKIFNGSIYCYYRDFPQGEIFDVFAIEGSPDTNPMPGVVSTEQ